MSLDLAIIEFIEPFMKNKTPLKDLSHIKRLRFISSKLAEEVEVWKEDTEMIQLAWYFHNLSDNQQYRLYKFLQSFGYEEYKAKEIQLLEKYHSKNVMPQTLAQKIMHDAHLLEGGPYFPLLRLITQNLPNSSSVEDSISMLEEELQKSIFCYTDAGQKRMELQKKAIQPIIDSIREYTLI